MARGERSRRASSRTLTAADAGRDHRQLHMIDRTGRVAAHTGAACIEWCGHRAGDGYSVAGNMLAGARVLDETAATFEAAPRATARRCVSSTRWRRARPPAATSAASRRRRSSSSRPRITPRSTCASTTTPSRSPSCGGCTKRASSDSSRSSPACRGATIRRASPIAASSKRDRALSGGAHPGRARD